MEIIKIMDIVNNKNEIVGVIQQEKYSNDLITFVVNTESIGISFNKLAEAINYINKFNYKAVIKDVLANGYKINDIEIVVNDPVKTFKNIYKNLLVYTIEKGFLSNYDYKYLNIKGVFDEAIKLLNEEVLKQWLINKEVKNNYLLDDEVFKMQDLSYELNKEVIKEAYKNWYYILNNSITGLTIAAY